MAWLQSPAVTYDELTELEGHLREIEVGDPPAKLLDLVWETVAASPGREWRFASTRQFMESLGEVNEDAVDDAYWWLIVHGFLRFRDISTWWDQDEEDEHEPWCESVDYSIFATRGLALIAKLQLLSPPPGSAAKPKTRRPSVGFE